LIILGLAAGLIAVAIGRRGKPLRNRLAWLTIGSAATALFSLGENVACIGTHYNLSPADPTYCTAVEGRDLTISLGLAATLTCVFASSYLVVRVLRFSRRRASASGALVESHHS